MGGSILGSKAIFSFFLKKIKKNFYFIDNFELSKFNYKNRKKQLLLNMINALLMGLTLGAAVYTSYKANENFNPAVGGAFLIGFYSIVFGLILNLVANRFIKKDEMLIRSVDRIR